MNTKTGNSAAAGVVGAVVGAGVAVAATKVLSNEKTRQKVVRMMGSIKDQVMSQEKLGEELEKGKRKVKKAMSK